MKDKLDAKLNHISFHTPGHNGGVLQGGNGFYQSLDARYDVTELSYSDNLLEARDGILELERKWASAYGADALFLTTNGATSAVFAAILSTCGKIAFVGGIHVSAFRAAELFHKSAVYLKDADELTKYLSDAVCGAATPLGAVFVTSPSYLGECADLPRFRALADGAGAALIVDSSHGSHFAFSKKLPVSATEYGDLVILSLHKTLPVLTGGAAIAARAPFAAVADTARRKIHSTSPSYLTLLSAEDALSRLTTAENDYSDVLDLLSYFLCDLEGTAFTADKTDDPTRLVLRSPYRAEEVVAYLEEKNIFAEYSDANFLVFIVTPFNKQYLAYLAECLKSVPNFSFYTESENSIALPIRKELDFSDKESEVLPLSQAVGRVFATPVGRYPPGIPLFFPGDPVTVEAVRYLQINRQRMFGLAKDGVDVVKY